MEKKFTLEFGSDAINTIFDALADKPYRAVAHIVAEIQRQIQAQQQESAPEEQSDGE